MHLGNAQTDWYLISNADRIAAIQRGENPCAPGYALSVTNGEYYCRRISAAQSGGASGNSAPISVNVSPSISTQASPQISPAFQQQYQPSNSPASAGTSQIAPTNQNSAQTSNPPAQSAPIQSGYSAADVENILRQQQAQYAAALERAVSAPSSQASPLPSMPAVNIDQSAPVPVAPVIPSLPGGAVPNLTSAPASDNKAGIMLALAGIVGLLAFRRKGKTNANG